jgi:N-acetyl-anhydromuramoyl-L-alanine amidase
MQAPGWLSGVRHHASPHFDARPEGTPVDLLVLHYISLPAGKFSGDAILRLFDGTLDVRAHPGFAALEGVRVSAHFVIRRRGQVIQCVAGDARAWHAGASSFQGRERCNDFSIGVELEGDEHHRFTESQYRSLFHLVPKLRTRYPLRWVTGHENIAPGRKFDPGPMFDWSRTMNALAPMGLSKPI